MRITTSLMVQNAMRHVRARLAMVSNAQDEAATLRRIRRMSDDPVDASQVLRLDAHLRDIEQYRRNASAARTRLDVEDVVLTSMRDLVSRAKNLAASVANLPPTDPVRQAALDETVRLRDQIVALGNTRVGNEYLFGGARTDTPPFLSNGAYVGDSTVRQAEVDDGIRVDTVHSGDQAISGALASMNTLMASLASSTRGVVETAAAGVGVSEQQLLAMQTETGERLRELADTGKRLTQRQNTFLDRREAIRDTDPAESLLKVTAAQTALERAYAVVGKVLSTNLLDYLR